MTKRDSPRDALKQGMRDWLRRHEDEMFQVLEAAVNIDSGSYDKPGVDRVGELLRECLAGGGIGAARQPFDAQGDCVSAELPADRSAVPSGAAVGGRPAGRHVLLLGHMDTVFPTGTVASRPFRTQGDAGYGPGVADMKAGLVMHAFVARAFAALGGNRLPIRLLFTGDEEIASPASRHLIQAAATGAEAVFNAEPGRPGGNVVTGRKGALFIDFEVRGVSAHAGVAPEKGASAIEALARKIVDLHRLADPGSGISANVGTVRGGMSVNTVADFAAGQLDVRFPGGTDREALRARIAEIIERESPACTCGRILREGIFLPMTATPGGDRLLAAYQASARALDFTVEGEFTGGSADSGLTTAVGAPTLCAVGPIGGNVHTEREYCRLDTLVPRAQALALTLLDLEPAG